MKATCRLCLKNRRLVSSHIVPKFIASWVKRTSATGYLRSGITPNIRAQDFRRHPLLCGECETRLSRWERTFARRVFFPYQHERRQKFPYEGWLLRFVISVSWRMIVAGEQRFRQDVPHLAPHVEEALETWRAFLMEERADSGTYEHHLFFLDFLVDARGDIPTGVNRYFTRAVDGTPVHSQDEIHHYGKLPAMIIWSAIKPPALTGWTGTCISESGALTSPQRIHDDKFGTFLMERISNVMGLMSNISERQRQRTLEAFLAQPERVLASETWRAMVADSIWQARSEVEE